MTVALGLLLAPFAAEGQPAGKVWRIGTLSAWPPSSREEAFRQGLRDLGYVEGQTVAIEARFADGRFERLPDLAAELVRLKVDVIVASPSEAARAAQRATRTMPIVVAFAADPVGTGLVAGLARPGGNVTGLSAIAPELTTKRLELLRVIVPELSRVSFLANPAIAKPILNATDAAGRALGVQVTHVIVRDQTELDRAFSAMAKSHVDGLIVDLTLQDRWRQIADFAIKSRLPTISGPREFVEAGGLMAYGPNYPDLFRRAALYVDKILKGAKPADLPVEQATKFEFVINMKTAKTLGLTIPQSVLVRVDEVIACPEKAGVSSGC